MNERRKNRLFIASLPLAAVIVGSLLHGRTAALAAVTLGAALLLTSGVLILGHKRSDARR